MKPSMDFKGTAATDKMVKIMFVIVFAALVVAYVNWKQNTFMILFMNVGKVPAVEAKTFFITIQRDGHFNIMNNGQVMMRDGPTFFRGDNNVYSTSDGTLKQHGEPLSFIGFDTLGKFTGQTISYTAGGKVVETTVRVYDIDEHFAIFTQTFVDGLNATAASDANLVISGFPSLQVGKTTKPVGFLEYQGVFVGWEKLRIGRWAENVTHLAGGLGGGPLLLFDTSGNVIIVSPFSQFMAASYEHNMHTSSISWGIMGKVNSVPPGYTYSTIVYLGSKGIRKAMMGWGSVLRQWYGHSPASGHDDDISMNYIGYYTDNGAYYYQVPEKGLNFEDTLLGVFNYSVKNSLPYRYLQYDDWFYPTAGPTGYGATVVWDALPSVFPHGLQYLYNVTRLPVVAHNRYWSDKTPYAKQNGGPFNFVFDGKGNALPDDQSFWDFLFSTAKLWGLVTYEQDWLNYQVEEIEPVHSDLTLGGRWLKQMGKSAARYGLTLQYCMSLPRHILAALEINAVTQVRASTDYHYRPNQYQVGITSLFLHAVGLTPFKDNFWTTRDEPGNRYNMTEENPMLQAVIAVLTTGPVGVSDRIGYTNVDLVRRLSASDGLLLQPSQPALAIDAQIMQAAFDGNVGPKGELWTTVSEISGISFGIIFSMNLQEPYVLQLGDTGWDIDVLGFSGYVYMSKYIMQQWQPPAPFDNDSPLHLTTCGSYTSFCLYYVSPLFKLSSTRLFLAGETDKIVPLSPKRVVSISATNMDVTVELKGTPGELVNFDVCNVNTQVSCSTVSCVISPTSVSQLSAVNRVCV